MGFYRRQRIRTGKNSYSTRTNNSLSHTTKAGNLTTTTRLGGGISVTENLGNGYFNRTYIKPLGQAGRKPRAKASGADDSESAALVFMLIGLAPFLALSYYTYNYTLTNWEWHPVFAGVSAAFPAILGLMLLMMRLFRIIYFGCLSVLIAGFTFLFISNEHDLIWASAGGLLALAIGWSLTSIAANLD